MKGISFSIKLKIQAGKASSLPPIGPVLGQYRINPAEFCKDFNEFTEMWDEYIVIPVLLVGYSNGEYEYRIKKPNICFLLKKFLEKESFSKNTKKLYAGLITLQQLFELNYLLCVLDEKSMLNQNTRIPIRNLHTICGTIFSMGIYII